MEEREGGVREEGELRVATKCKKSNTHSNDE